MSFFVSTGTSSSHGAGEVYHHVVVVVVVASVLTCKVHLLSRC